MRAIPEVKPMILTWFCDNYNILDMDARSTLAKKLSSCDDDNLRELPEHANAINVYPFSKRTEKFEITQGAL